VRETLLLVAAGWRRLAAEGRDAAGAVYVLHVFEKKLGRQPSGIWILLRHGYGS
jgi:hypothetical protein